MQREENILSALLYVNVLVLSIIPEHIAFPLSLLFIYYLVAIFRKKTTFLRSDVAAFFCLSLTFWAGLLGLINTVNIPEGLFDLSRALPVMLLPLILFPLSPRVSKETLQTTFLLFAAGTIIKLAELFIVALINYSETSQITYFFYTGLSRQTNSFSYYLAVSYFIIYFLFSENDLINQYIPFLRRIRVLEIALLLIITTGIVFLQAKGVIVSFIIVNIVIILIRFRKKPVYRLIISLSVCIILFATTGLKDRFHNFFSDSKTIISKQDDSSAKMDSSLSSTPLRYHAMVSSWKLINENPMFGVGTGDLIDNLKKEYMSENFLGNYQEATAPHNQFLRSFTKNGLAGLFALLIYFIFSFKVSLQKRNPLYLAFTLIIFLCCFSNDLFDSGGGAPLIGFLGTFLYLYSRTNSFREGGSPEERLPGKVMNTM